MIADPPVDNGALQVTVACVLLAVAVTLVGAPGTVAGVTAFDALDDSPVPTLFVGTTPNVYDVPFVSPMNVAVSVEPSTAAVRPSGFEVTVYCVIGLPPSDDGAIHATVAVAFPAMAVTPVGASGGPVGLPWR